MKDSLTNVEDTGEFVYNMCTADLLDKMVVAGIHYIQEDSPDEIGRAIADLVRELGGA